MSASLTIRQAAEQLGVTERRVRQLARESRLAKTGSGRALRISPSDINSLQRTRTRAGRPPESATTRALGDMLTDRTLQPLPKRTQTRLRNLIRYGSSTEMARHLLNCPDSDLARLGATALDATSFLERRRALASIAQLQREWEQRNPDARALPTELIRQGARTSGDAAEIINRALQSDDSDAPLRFALETFHEWLEAKPEYLDALLREDPRVSDPRWQAFLEAASEKAALSLGRPIPDWTGRTKLSSPWHIGGKVSDQAIAADPIFRKYDIMISDADLTRTG